MGLIQKGFGARLTSSDFNEVARQGVIPCTSSSRPSTPFVGMTIYETDTKRLMEWDGVAWRPPWNLPWGILGAVSIATPHSEIGTSPTDVNDSTMVVTTVAHRNLLITATVGFALTAAGPATTAQCFVSRGGTVVGGANALCSSIEFADTASIMALDTPPAGSTTYKLVAQTSNDMVDTTASATTPIYFVVQDIGPNGDPA